jgi:hypothetical protein
LNGLGGVNGIQDFVNLIHGGRSDSNGRIPFCERDRPAGRRKANHKLNFNIHSVQTRSAEGKLRNFNHYRSSTDALNESVGDAPMPLILGADSPGTLIGTQSPLHRHKTPLPNFSRDLFAPHPRV